MRMLLSIGSALVALAVLGACSVNETPGGDTGGDGQGSKEITFLTFETPNLTPEVWDAAIRRVTDRHPDIKVTKLVSPTQDRTAYAKQLLASNQLPDVLVAVSPAGFAESGALAEWTPEELGDFRYPRNGAINGKVYQLPANTQTIPVVYYNKTLFAQAGITEPPRTYAELLEISAKLKAAGSTPFVIGGGKTIHDALGPTFAGILAAEVYARNPNWMADRRQGRVTFADQEFTRGAAKLADLAAKGYIDRNMLSQDYAATQSAFLTGKGAMYAMGNWFAAAADDPKTKPDFEIGQFFWPSDEGQPAVAAFTGGGLLVNAKAKNLEAAKRFALAYQLDKQNLDTSCKADGLIPAIRDYTPPSDVGPVYKAGFDMFRAAEEAKTVVPAFGFEAGDDGMLVGVPEKWDSSMADLVTGQKSAQEVAAFLDAEWEKAS